MTGSGEERTGYGHWQDEDEADSPSNPEPRPEEAEAAADPAEPPAGPTCELCGGPTMELHCKITCIRCGYQRDCSDP